MMPSLKFFRTALSAVQYALFAAFFSSVWPVVTLFATTGVLMFVILVAVIATVVARHGLDDMLTFRESDIEAAYREVLSDVYGLPALALVMALGVPLVWCLSAPSYSTELTIYAAAVSALKIAWWGVKGVPALPRELA